jgi:hypothetical protein
VIQEEEIPCDFLSKGWRLPLRYFEAVPSCSSDLSTLLGQPTVFTFSKGSVQCIRGFTRHGHSWMS